MAFRVDTLLSGVSRAAIGAAFSLTLLVSTATAGEVKSFNIPVQEATSAIRTFGTQSGLQVLATVDDLKGKRVNAVVGKLDVHDALRLMLAGTGLTYRETDANTVLIEKPRAAAASLPASTSTGSTTMAAAQPQPEPPASAEAPPSEASDTKVEKVVVTGSRIRGAKNKTAPVIEITRDDIDKSGYSSPEQVIQSLPQNYAGGQNGASEFGRFGNGSSSTFNIGGTSGVNLRGLGTTSTLTLIDGHRVASSIRGTAVDVSLIPISAIERVEVLTDGASAIYGSDAIAGVVNFILRKDFEGAETRARYGTVTEGSTEEFLLSQAVGTNWTGGNAFLNVQHRTRDALPVSDREFSKTALRPSDLMPDIQDTSAMFSGRQELGNGLEVFALGLYTNKDFERHQTSTSQISIQDTHTEFYGASSGVSYDFADDWSVELSGTYSDLTDENSAFYSLGAPAGYVNGVPLIDNHFVIWSGDAQVTGSLFELPGGAVRAAFGGSWREEEATYKANVVGGVNGVFDRSIGAIFGELYVPLVGEANAIPLINRLEVSLAARYDDYSDFGDTTNPRVGLFWSPMEELGFRAAYSTSFRAPSAADQMNGTFGNNILTFNFVRPGGGAPQPVFLLTGGGDELKPETAENFTAGVTYTPNFWAGLTLTAEYFSIDFSDRIVVPPVDTQALLHPEIYGSLITPLADDAAALAYLNARLAEGYNYFNFIGTGPTGVRYVYTTVQQNAAHVQESGIDFRIAFPFDIDENNFSFQANVAYIDELTTAFTANSAPADILNTYGNPLRYRGRSSLSWSAGEFGATVSANYAGSYRDTGSVPVKPVEAWTTADLTMTYSPEALKGITFNASVLNLFDEDPPRVQGFVPGVFFDAGNATPLGRFVAVEIRTKW
ncbi:MAG: TonB-dependent receptor [Alphaproteobacteria bacterium]|jgi:outer membrane receptor protein involved in Fe transport|nr:TonB-dependent receptor [Alphaproteobacteria bacterium]